MKRKRVLGIIGITALVVVTGIYGGVQAQQNEGSDSVGLDVTVRSDETMSGQQQLAWIRTKTEGAKRIGFQVQNMLDLGRQEKDTLKITCLNDKLTQIRVNLRGVEERTQALEIAVQTQDTSTANQQFSILQIYISRIEGLKAEAENCLGEVDIVLGQTETVVTVDDDITPSDPTEDVPVVEPVGIDPSPPASAYY